MALADERWLVTGAAGTVGRCVVARLVGAVQSLALLDSAPLDGAGGVQVDVRDFAGLLRVTAGLDGIVHLAAVPDEADFDDLVDVNVLGTRNVLEAARRNGVRRVVLASSNRVTGFWPVSSTIDVEAPPRPDGFYGVSKVACEALGRLYADKFNVEFVGVRIGTLLERPTNVRHLSTWLSHRDCGEAFVAAMTAPVDRFATFYAVSRNTRRFWDLEAGRRLGFEPVDDAERFAADFLDETIPGGVQGGAFATPEFSLDRQKQRS